MAEQLDLSLPGSGPRRQRKPRPSCGARVKQKGSGYERTVARILQAIWPGAWRGQQRHASFTDPDITNTPVWWETKVGKRLDLLSALRQAENDLSTRGGGRFRFAAVIARRDREPDVLVMRLADALPLLRTWSLTEKGSKE